MRLLLRGLSTIGIGKSVEVDPFGPVREYVEVAGLRWRVLGVFLAGVLIGAFAMARL